MKMYHSDDSADGTDGPRCLSLIWKYERSLRSEKISVPKNRSDNDGETFYRKLDNLRLLVRSRMPGKESAYEGRTE